MASPLLSEIHIPVAATPIYRVYPDRVAFGVIYRQGARMVHGILAAHVPPADAVDLIQDVFLRAMGQLEGLREPGAVGGCLATIARNAACDYRRRARPVVEVHQAMASVKPTADAFAALDAIQALPEAYRETLCLRRIEGMTGPEIAERTGMTHESVRVNLCHGMNMLREKLT